MSDNQEGCEGGYYSEDCHFLAVYRFNFRVMYTRKIVVCTTFQADNSFVTKIAVVVSGFFRISIAAWTIKRKYIHFFNLLICVPVRGIEPRMQPFRIKDFQFHVLFPGNPHRLVYYPNYYVKFLIRLKLLRR